MTRWMGWTLAGVALQASAAQFTMTAPITLAGKDALHRLELPLEVYRDARADLGDVRVLDGAGDPVPYAWARAPEGGKATPASTPLPFFAIAQHSATPETGSGITIRAADGALVHIRGAAKPAAVPRPRAYLLDASALKDPIAALVFDWEPRAGGDTIEVHLAESDDLRAWREVADAALVHLEREGRILTQPRIELAPRKAKYLRITWREGELALRGVRAESVAATVAPERHASRANGREVAPGEWTYDLGARLRVEAVQVRPAQANDVIAATISVRDDEREAWRPVARGAFYHLDRHGTEARSPPLEIGSTSARYWRIQAPQPRQAPQLEVFWPGRELVFVARGEGPFTLAFGDPRLQPAALPLDSLLPGYEKGAETRLPLARAGEAKRGPPPTRWERLMAASPRRIALWAILLAGVALLGFMAWRLARGG